MSLDRIKSEEVMHQLFSLPENVEDSDADPDYESEDDYSSYQLSATEKSLSFLGEELVQNYLYIEEDNADVDNKNEDVTDWNQNLSIFNDLNLNFLNPGNSTHTFSATDSEIDYFEKIFDLKIYKMLCFQSNLYAQQRQRIVENKRWKRLDIEELKAFLGMVIIQGIHVLPELKHYWSCDPILNVNAVSSVMTIYRFRQIIQNIHCNDNTLAVPKNVIGHDKLFKVRPLLEQIRKNIFKAYSPSDRLSIDECIIPFKGRSSLNQYMPLKPIKRGYKVWCIADSTNGYVLDFEIYTGENENIGTNFTLGESIVIGLSEFLENSKKIVAFNNFFTSYNLLKYLKEKDIYACGAVRPFGKNLPHIFRDKHKLKKGEYVYAQKDGIAAIKWQDNKTVLILSTAHNPTDKTTMRRKNQDGSITEIKCPKVVKVYNEIMGGVDHFDQNREKYAIDKKCHKYWHRIMYFLIDLAIVNSFTIWKLNGKGDDQLAFRLNLAKQLIGNFTSRKIRGKTVAYNPIKKNVEPVPNEIRYHEVGKHFPLKESSYRRCRKCSTKAKDKRTKFICSLCHVPLCAAPCFTEFHLNIKNN